MSHPFGNRISQHLHRKHGLSQKKLADGINQDPAVITAMCHGRRLQGPSARQRILAIIEWFHQQEVLDTVNEANALLESAGLAPLQTTQPEEARLIQRLASQLGMLEPQHATTNRQTDPREEMSLALVPVAQSTQLATTKPAALQRPYDDVLAPLDKTRNIGRLWSALGFTRMSIVLVVIIAGLVIWIRMFQSRPIWQETFNPLHPTQWKAIQHSAEWEDVSGPSALLRENNPIADYGKIETQPIIVDTHKDPLLHINVISIDEHASYTIQIKDLLTGHERDVLKGITYAGEQVIQLNTAMKWSDLDSQPFTMNIWISGEARTVTFSIIEIIQ